MKKSKFIFSSVIGLVAIGIIGTTIALYSRIDAQKDISIEGSITSDGDFTLSKVSDSTVSSDDFKFDPDNRVFTVKYNLGANISESSLYKQPISVATAKISVETTDSSYARVFDYAKVSASVGGYINENVEESIFATDTKLHTFEFAIADDKLSTSASLDIAFSNNLSTSYGTQFVTLQIDLSDVSDENLFTHVLDTGFKYKIDLTNTTNYNYAYVIGDFDDCNWEEQEAYRMVPNIAAKTEFEWMYQGLQLESGNKLKCKIGSDYSSNDYNEETNEFGNYTYNGENGAKAVYWNGKTGSAIIVN